MNPLRQASVPIYRPTDIALHQTASTTRIAQAAIRAAGNIGFRRVSDEVELDAGRIGAALAISVRQNDRDDPATSAGRDYRAFAAARKWWGMLLQVYFLRGSRRNLCERPREHKAGRTAPFD
jgi:hypothetical protein